MLRKNQKGSIIGLIITLIAIFIVIMMFRNTYYQTTPTNDTNNSSGTIDQAKDAVEQTDEAGKKANTILKGLTGN